METKTIIERIEYEPQTGNTTVKMLKQIVDDQGRILSSQPHRTTADPTMSVSDQIAAVNVHLAASGFATVKTEDVALLDKITAEMSDHRAEKAQGRVQK